MPAHERQITQIHYSLKREINELYWALALKSFAVGLLGIFFPIYIYLLLDKSLEYTLFFYLVQFFLHTLLVPFASRLIQHVGVKKMMAIGNPILAIYILLIVFATEPSLFILGSALFFKIVYMSIFWPSRHIDFAKFTKGNKTGRQLGTANIIVSLAKTAAPLIGGLAIVNFGFEPVFIFGAILIAVSTIPLFFSPEVYETYSLSWRQSFQKIWQPKLRRTSLAFFFEGAEYMAGLVFLPIFLYLVIGKLEVLGWVTSLSLFIALFFTYIIGWATDKKGSAKIIDLASIAHAFAWLINIFIKTPLQFALYNSFFRVTEVSVHLPFVSKFYEKAKKSRHGIDEYIVFHEIVHNLGRVAMLGLGIVLVTTNSDPWMFIFMASAITAVLYQFINNKEDTLWSKLKYKLNIGR